MQSHSCTFGFVHIQPAGSIMPSSSPRLKRSDRIAMFALRTLKTVSFVMFLKGVMGFAMLALALFGVTVPYFGIEPTALGSGLAATAGAVLGGLLALRA